MALVRTVAAAAVLVFGHSLAQASDAFSAQVSLSGLSYSVTSLDGVSTPTATFTPGYTDPNLYYGPIENRSSASVTGGYIVLPLEGGSDNLGNESAALSSASPFPSSASSITSGDGIGQVGTSPNQVSAGVHMDSANLGNLYSAVADTGAYQFLSYAGVSALPWLTNQDADVWQLTLSAHTSITVSATMDYSLMTDETALRAALDSFGGDPNTFGLAVMIYAGFEIYNPTAYSGVDQFVGYSAGVGPDAQGQPTSVDPASQALSISWSNDTDTAQTYVFDYATVAGLGLSVNSLAPSAIPEPGTWALMGLGLGLLGWGVRRQRRTCV
jgi:hypothetical protein